MPRQREYHERDYEYDEPPYRGERPPANRRPPRRNRYEEDYSERRRTYPRQSIERSYGDFDGRRHEQRGNPRGRYFDDYPPNRLPRNPRPTYERERTAPRRDTRPQRPVSMGSPSSPQPLQQAKKSTQRKMFLFVYNLFFYTLTIGILLSSLMFAFSEKSDAAIFGHRFYQVLTDSMAPQPDSPSKGFYSGDIVLVKMTDGSGVKEGDIVTFQVGEGDRYLTHRMIKRLEELNGEPGDYIVTKGDANNTADPPIEASRVYGKVTFVIPKMGSVLTFVQENLWLCLVCVLSTFGFFLVLKAYFLQPETIQEGPRKPKRYTGV